MINGGQIRAARLLVGWTQSQLSLESGVSISSISKIEKVERANEQTLAKLGVALIEAGVEFTDGTTAGVKLKPKQT